MAAKVRQIQGAWWVVTHHHGKRQKKRIGLTKAHKRQAEEIAKQINARLILGESADGGGKVALPCSAELRRWHQIYAPTMKSGYAALTLGIIDNHLTPFFGDRTLAELGEAELLEFVKEKLDSGLSPATIKNSLSLLRRVCSVAVRERRLDRNPASGIGELMRRVGRANAEEVEETKTWSRDEISTLLDVASQHEVRFAPMLALLFSTGMRRGEAIGLKWSDFDSESRELTIRRSVTAYGVSTPKTGKARRVAISQKTAEGLQNLFGARRREALQSGWAEVPEWVFPSGTGSAQHPRNVVRAWHRVRRRAQNEGVRPLRLHCTRHTWATFALKAGKSIRWVADQLGHADPALTLRVYAHALREEESDLSFADFNVPKRPYTAPTKIRALSQSRNSAEDMVTRVRFERTTPSFGGWCSIQLSYRATRLEPGPLPCPFRTASKGALFQAGNSMVGRSGLEPPTSAV